MSIEEKAKAYDEALKWMRELYPELHGATKEDAEHYFPELRESEDERVIRTLFFLCKDHDWLNGATKEECLNWLEKQKINTEGDFGRGYDCGYQAGYAVAMNEMKPKVATATPDSCKDSLRVSESCKENASSFTDEDERIRKALVDYFSQEELYDFSREQVLAWLEKQQEIPMPDSTELIEMWHKEEAMLKEKDFRGDEWRLAYNAFLDGFAQGMMVKQEEQKKDNPLEDFSRGYNAGYYHGRTDKEQKPRWEINNPHTTKWTKEMIDEKFKELVDYSGLTDLERAIHRGFLSAGIENVPVTIIKETAKDCLAHMPAEWSEEDKNKIDVIIRLVEQNSGWPDRAIKEYVNWLKSLRPQPHQTDEDKSISKEILEYFNEKKDYRSRWYVWVKHASRNPHWKPSKEQMEALECEIKYCYACGLHEGGRKLQSLYEQLKKL